MRPIFRGAVLAVVILMGSGIGSRAQQPPEADSFCRDEARQTETVDVRGLGVVYCATHPGVAYSLQWAHASARPIFYGAVPVAWGTTVLRDGRNYADAYRLTVTQGVAYGLVYGLKRIVGRPRPYVTRALSSRSSHHPAPGDRYTSFPSGHATLSAALVTSWGLSHPQWYIVGPGALWAVGVSLSRLHLGVHYPTDIAAGMALGAGVGVLVHHFRSRLTPQRIRNGSRAASFATLPVSIHLRF